MRLRFPRPFRRAAPRGEQTYREIVWENAVEAYESTPDEPIEITPYIQSRLDATKAELLLKAHRMKRDHDRIVGMRRRHLRVAVISAALLVGGSAGASALTNTGTGIPIVDSVLGTPQQREHRPEDFSPGTSLPAPEDLRIGSESSIASLRVRLGGKESDTLLVTAFASENDRLCLVLARATGEGLADVAGRSGCLSPEYIEDELSRPHALIVTTVADRAVVVGGYAAQDVAALQVRGPHGALDVEMTEPWTALPGSTPMRLFVAVIAPEELNGGTDPDEADRALDARLYEMRATLSDGRVIVDLPRP